MTPAITIGLPVHNGAEHLEAAIESLLAQRFGDFRLVICDNASTDATAEIAAGYAQRDHRVRVVRHAENIGAVRNFLFAGRDVDSPYFCWAAHDDIRDPRFLEHLHTLLSDHLTAALACCAVRNIDPDGTPRDLRRETRSLRTTVGMTPAQRIRLYLREAPGTPFYGLYRTAMLRDALESLNKAAEHTGPPLLGLDMIFLAGLIARHDWCVTHEPLLLFRRGGFSHRLDAYGSLREYIRHLVRFLAALKQQTDCPRLSRVQRCIISLARWRYFLAMIFSQPMRRMTWHYVTHAFPAIERIHAWWQTRRHPAFRRLRRRLHHMPKGTRIVLFGAGKHTRRCMNALQMAIKGHASIAAVTDDRADERTWIGRVPQVAAERVQTFRPDLILVSSDAYEATLHRRACAIAPTGTPVWCLYDTSLETSASSASACSTSAMNAVNSSMPSAAFRASDSRRSRAVMSSD